MLAAIAIFLLHVHPPREEPTPPPAKKIAQHKPVRPPQPKKPASPK
jgi:hypothetical protein